MSRSASSVRTSPAELTLPGRIGPYRLCFELGSGGMAQVYLAVEEGRTSGDPLVALKVIHPHLGKQRGFLEMFADEADIAARIRHPNVCRVLQYDTRDWPYIAMEYLLGESLAKIHRTLSREENEDGAHVIAHAAHVAAALAQACAGLHEAHELTDDDGEPLDVVHRDVSPENIFLTYDGVAKIVDFGVAAAGRKRHRTEAGIVKGKLSYIAPELLDPVRTVDRRADIWSIGVVAWELLTTKRLFRHDSPIDTLRAVDEAPIAPPSEVRPGLPKEIDEVVMRALARDPAERYQTARELGRALARYAAANQQVSTHADLADWMNVLFPGGRAKKLGQLELATHLGSEDEPRGEDAAATSERRVSSSDERAETQVRSVTNEETTPAARTLVASASPRASRARLAKIGRMRRESRWIAWSALAAGVFALITAALVGGFVARGSTARTNEPMRTVSTSPAAMELARTEALGVPVSDAPPQILADGEEDVSVVRGGYAIDVGRGADGEIVLRIRPAAGAEDPVETEAPPAVREVERAENLVVPSVTRPSLPTAPGEHRGAW
jgi:serine/threonine-protein kinase